MGRVKYPTADYSDGSFAFGEDVYEDMNRIYTEFNGNIQAINLATNAVGVSQIKDGAVSAGKLATPCVTNAKWAIEELSLDGILAWTFFPNYPGSGGGLIARFLITTPLSSGASPKKITYVLNGVDGFPAFSEIPTFLGAPIVYDSVGVVVVTAMRVTDKSVGNVTVEYTYTGNGTVSAYFGLAGGI